MNRAAIKLIDHLASHGISRVRFAETLKVHDSTVSYWCSGKNIPSRPMRIRIRRETGDYITSNDWDEDACEEVS